VSPADPPHFDLELGQTIRGFAPGQKVVDRYSLVRVLGHGGMGIVWLARDGKLNRDVALKFLPDLVIHDAAVLDDLKRETNRSLELTHPHIVRIHDFVDDAQSACISMEYVDGPTLSALRVQLPVKVFEVPELAPWIKQTCEALDYAHNRARIVHRDLKPANLMLNSKGDLKVADFGVARSLTDSVSRLTMTHGTSGTLVYMSPQQLGSGRASHLDDIYSLGATIYELLTSKPPFYGGDITTQINTAIPASMSQRREDLEIAGAAIPQAWEATVASCLAKDPAQRPQSAMEVAERLGLTRQQYGRSAAAQPISPSGKTAQPLPGKALNWKFVVPAAAAAVILLGGLLVWYYASQGEGKNKGAAVAKNETEQSPRAPTVSPLPLQTASAPNAAPRDRVALGGDDEKASYSLGHDIGSTFKKQNVEINLDAMFAGIKDAIAGRDPLLSKEEREKVLEAFQKKMTDKQIAANKEAGGRNAAAGKKFLAENQTKEGVRTTASGLQYKVLKEGNGPSPKETDTVVTHYKGTLIDGTEFDSSYKRGQAATFPVNRVIKGWTEALQMMKVGSRYQLFIPPELAYGERGAGKEIGPNATLIFDVELFSIEPASAASPKPKP
jgi:FKBP-type peptidyl-prolyl cis-trans isomerase/serine/threonine protein kinase